MMTTEMRTMMRESEGVSWSALLRLRCLRCVTINISGDTSQLSKQARPHSHTNTVQPGGILDYDKRNHLLQIKIITPVPSLMR